MKCFFKQVGINRHCLDVIIRLIITSDIATSLINQLSEDRLAIKRSIMLDNQDLQSYVLASIQLLICIVRSIPKKNECPITVKTNPNVKKTTIKLTKIANRIALKPWDL